MLHPAVLGFADVLKKRREWVSQNVTPTSRIPLPFHWQTLMQEKSSLFLRDLALKVVIVQLKAMVERYALTNNGQDLEDF